MVTPWAYALLAGAYIYGSVPFGFLAAKLLRGVDLREVGSGNIGATNAARALGAKFFPSIFLLDMSKGFLPVWLAGRLVGGAGPYQPHPLAVAAGLAAILGHVFPVWLGFRGGKAVATSAGVLLGLSWPALLAGALVWAAVFALWRYVSLASICAALAVPVAAVLLGPEPLGSGAFLTGFTVLGALLVVARHRGNIRRLLSGTEQKAGRRPPSGGS